MIGMHTAASLHCRLSERGGPVSFSIYMYIFLLMLAFVLVVIEDNIYDRKMNDRPAGSEFEGTTPQVCMWKKADGKTNKTDPITRICCRRLSRSNETLERCFIQKTKKEAHTRAGCPFLIMQRSNCISLCNGLACCPSQFKAHTCHARNKSIAN